MKSVLSVALAQLVLISMAACGSSSSAGGSCSFSFPGYGDCEDFVGVAYSTSAIIQADCTKGNGTYSSSACPSAGALGTCVLESGNPAQVRFTYYATDGGTSTTMEQMLCTAESGTWTAG
jgi:hypothetical protein